jgi:hypothetical protein
LKKSLNDILIQLALIVVGVLSALGVDNYRESIQEHRTEKEYLISLRNALQADTAILRTEVQKVYDKINATTELFKLSKLATPIDAEKFENIVTDVIMLIRPRFVTAVYEELKFTGNLKLIRNKELKSLIISYYSDNEVIQQQNDRQLFGYPAAFVDILTFDEMEYRIPFDQKRIFKAIETEQLMRTELLRCQKLAGTVRKGMIYTSLPQSIALLEKLQEEIDK